MEKYIPRSYNIRYDKTLKEKRKMTRHASP